MFDFYSTDKIDKKKFRNLKIFDSAKIIALTKVSFMD